MYECVSSFPSWVTSETESQRQLSRNLGYLKLEPYSIGQLVKAVSKCQDNSVMVGSVQVLLNRNYHQKKKILRG